MVNEALNTIKEIANNMSPHVLTNLGVASAISTFAAKVNTDPKRQHRVPDQHGR
ncbi:MAG: hypothetical protein MZV63_50490 [Marinilabiliales bacterium]|nr:hypothetical protein [Marinilabiliales bacterium]